MNERTDSAYWDQFWQASRRGVKLLDSRDAQFGRRGTFVRAVHARLGSLVGQRVLEVGGGGLNFRVLALRKWLGAQVTVVDYSEEALRLVGELFKANEESLEKICADVLRLDRPLPMFDVVTHWGVLEHFQDPVPMLSACAACLKPGGRMLFTMPNMLAWAASLWRTKAPENWATHVLHRDEELDAACPEAGFELTERFFTGLPFISDTSWEWRGPLARSLALTQRVIGVSARFAPVGRIRGRRVSKDRGFLAIRSAGAFA